MAVGQAALTGDDGRHSPADGIVETHGPEVDIAGFSLHAVDVEALDEEPGEGGEEEAVEEDGNHSAKKLGRQQPLRDGPTVPTLTAPSMPRPHPHGHACSSPQTWFSVRLMPRRKSSSEKKRVTVMLEWMLRVLDLRPLRQVRKEKVSSRATKERDTKE